MAEKSSELERVEGDENSLEMSDENRDAPATGNFDAEAALAETAETDDATEIRQQIEETRSQMSETIDAIQEKLSVANITEQVKDQVSEQITGAVETAKDAVYGKANALAQSVGKSFAQLGDSDVARKAQENPWLFSVVGMGIGAVLVGVLASGRKSKRKGSYDSKKYIASQTRQQYGADEASQFKYQYAETETSGIVRPSSFKAEKTDKTEGTEKSGVQSGSRTADATSTSLSERAGAVYESISGAAGKTYETVGKASSYTYDKAGDLGEAAVKNYKHYIEVNPLAVGAVAVAVGAAVGYAIPLTKIEDQYFGEVRDRLVDQAQTSAQDAIGSVKQAVGEARQIIADEVKSQTATK